MGAELTMRFNAKCYHATVANLLKRFPLKWMKEVQTSEAKESEETDISKYLRKDRRSNLLHIKRGCC